MRRVTFFCFLLLLAAAFSAPTEAQTASFQANCLAGIPTSCTFDASRPAGSGSSCPAGTSITKYFWDFGVNNTSFTWTTSNPTNYTYPTGISTDVCLTVFCSNGSSATTCRCFSNVIGVGGCIRPGAGWTP
jgi:hypothetical protein